LPGLATLSAQVAAGSLLRLAEMAAASGAA